MGELMKQHLKDLAINNKVDCSKLDMTNPKVLKQLFDLKSSNLFYFHGFNIGMCGSVVSHSPNKFITLLF